MRIYFFFLILLICKPLHAQTISDSAGKQFNEYLSLYEEGEFVEAKMKLEKILEYRDSLPSTNIALVYNNLGLVEWKLCRYEKAKEYYQIAFSIISDNNPAAKRIRVLALNNYGILQYHRGENSSALDYYFKAEDIIHSFEEKDQSYYKQISMIYLNKAQAYYRLGNYSESLRNSIESTQIKSKYGFPYIGSTYFVQAKSYEKLSMPEKAHSSYLSSISRWTLEYDSTYYELANVYLEYGQFLTNQGNDRIGMLYFDKALENYLVNYGQHHTYTASAYHLIAEYYLKNKNFPKTFENIQLALASVCPGFESKDISGNPPNKESLLDLRLLKIYKAKIDALAQYAEEVAVPESKNRTEIKDAISYLEFAISTNVEAIKVLSRIQGSYLSQESRLYLAENQNDIFVSGIENALQLYGLTGDSEYQDLAYYFASIGKSLELRYELNRKEELFLRSQRDTTATGLLTLKENLDSYSNLIQMEQSKSKSDSIKIKKWQQERFELTRSYETEYYKVFGQELDTIGFQPFTENYVADIQSRIGRYQTCIEYTLTDPDSSGSRELYAFLYNRKGLRIYESTLDLGFEKRIEEINKYFSEFNPIENNSEDTDSLNFMLRFFYQKLVEPIEDGINGNRIIIVPDNELAFIPFGALIRDLEESYLIRDYEISYALNAQQISRGQNQLLINKPELRIIAHNYTDSRNYPDQTDSSVSILVSNPLLELGSAEKEAEQILDVIQGRWIKDNLAKEKVIQQIREADILHFAMHASSSTSESSSTFLALSSASDSTYSNLLFDYEIEPLNLSTDLVVLNACSSGSGLLYHGEGIFSLSRSFLLGGTKAIVHTQWTIDDNTSSTIISQFYKGLSCGMRKSKALRHAQLRYLEESFPAFRHPYYWAAYQTVGDDSPVAPNRRMQITLICLGLIVSVLVLVRYRQKRKGKRAVN